MTAAIASEEKNRLIVLVPDSLTGDLDLARQVFWMAVRKHLDIFLIALIDDAGDFLPVTNSLTTIKAIVSGEDLGVQSELAKSSDWLRVLRSVYRPGDEIICHQEQSVKEGWLKSVPANQFLSQSIGAPVITFSGYYHPQRDLTSRWARSLAAWLGFLVIIAGFTALEIRLDALLPDLASKVAISAAVIFEFTLIWVWDNFLNRLGGSINQ